MAWVARTHAHKHTRNNAPCVFQQCCKNREPVITQFGFHFVRTFGCRALMLPAIVSNWFACTTAETWIVRKYHESAAGTEPVRLPAQKSHTNASQRRPCDVDSSCFINYKFAPFRCRMKLFPCGGWPKWIVLWAKERYRRQNNNVAFGHKNVN